MSSVWQRLSAFVGSFSERTGLAGSLANALDPDPARSRVALRFSDAYERRAFIRCGRGGDGRFVD